jgi:uncharacterized protein YdeI (YjbR/CyaY-like superfamily)
MGADPVARRVVSHPLSHPPNVRRLELDDAPRVVEVPDDLAAELATDPAAKAAWDKLSFSHQRAHAESITGAKAPATRVRRVAKVLEALRP